MDPHPDSRLRATGAFIRAALIYWTSIWPQTHREIARLRDLATRIEDPARQTAALENLIAERGNLEGAAAFAVLAPRRRRRQLVTALVAFQAIYDYADTLAELDRAQVRQSHLALRAALRPAAGTPAGDRGGAGSDPYLEAVAVRCDASISDLPGATVVLPMALRAVEGMIEYQVRNHAPDPAAELERWKHQGATGSAGYSWWEAAASAASSLVVFALLALAAKDRATEQDADAVVRAYVPAGALHVLLDSHADREADARSGDHSLIAHYLDRATTTARLAYFAAQARSESSLLRRAATHRLILGAMASFYLVDDDQREPAGSVRAALGPFAAAAGLVLHLRRQGAEILTRRSRRRG